MVGNYIIEELKSLKAKKLVGEETKILICYQQPFCNHTVVIVC